MMCLTKKTSTLVSFSVQVINSNVFVINVTVQVDKNCTEYSCLLACDNVKWNVGTGILEEHSACFFRVVSRSFEKDRLLL